jgi:hypothetical protein
LAKGGRAGDIPILQCLYNNAAPAILYTGPTDSVKDGCLNARPSSNYITAIWFRKLLLAEYNYKIYN